jgi:lactam utilization protein B
VHRSQEGRKKKEMTKKNQEPTPIESADAPQGGAKTTEGNQTSTPAVEKKPKTEKGNWVSMVKDGVMIHGVHPDAVKAHEAIGYVLVPVEKSIEPADRSADNG